MLDPVRADSAYTMNEPDDEAKPGASDASSGPVASEAPVASLAPVAPEAPATAPDGRKNWYNHWSIETKSSTNPFTGCNGFLSRMTVTDIRPGKVSGGGIGTGLSSLGDAELPPMMRMVKRSSWKMTVTMTAGMLKSIIWELKE